MTTRDEAIRLAREAGLIGWVSEDFEYFQFSDHELMSDKLIHLITRAKNEAYREVAKIAFHEVTRATNDGDECWAECASYINVAILALVKEE